MYYVAYGSNMNLKQMAYRCPNSKVVGTGKLIGWKLVFNVHLDIIKTYDKNDVVPVVLWDIADEDWAYLDIYEGYPSYYIREVVEVLTSDYYLIDGIAYVMVKDRKGIYPPSKEYYETCEIGCFDNGISTKYLEDALNYSYDNMTRFNQYRRKNV